jgi:hypothetical protein
MPLTTQPRRSHGTGETGQMKQVIYEHCKVSNRFAATIGSHVYMDISPASAERVKQFILSHRTKVQYINLKDNYFGMRSEQ